MRLRARPRTKLVAAVIVSVLASHPAAAADWWRLGESVEGARVFSDADSLRCARDRCSLWERTVPATAEAGQVVDSLAEYDCDGRWTATKAEAAYGPRMNRLSFVVASTPKWQLVEAGTVGEDSMLFACRAQVGDLPRDAGQTVVVEGRTYVRDVSIRMPPPPMPGPVPASTSPAAPARPEPPPAGAAYSAQVGAVGSWAAERALEGALLAHRPGLRRGLKITVELGVAAGRQVYRAVVVGFTSAGEAEAFCAAEHRQSRPCLVRSTIADGRG